MTPPEAVVVCRTFTHCPDVPEIAGALGHCELAHRVINRLYKADVRSMAALRAMTDRELLEVRDRL